MNRYLIPLLLLLGFSTDQTKEKFDWRGYYCALAVFLAVALLAIYALCAGTYRLITGHEWYDHKPYTVLCSEDGRFTFTDQRGKVAYRIYTTYQDAADALSQDMEWDARPKRNPKPETDGRRWSTCE